MTSESRLKREQAHRDIRHGGVQRFALRRRRRPGRPSTREPPASHRPRRGLFFLAPLVAEFLLGNLPITLLAALVLLAPMYGGGALLIREVARRAGRGVPTMLLLGVAYGLLEEGVATQSLFNPHYVGRDLLSVGYVPGWGSRCRGPCSC